MQNAREWDTMTPPTTDLVMPLVLTMGTLAVGAVLDLPGWQITFALVFSGGFAVGSGARWLLRPPRTRDG